MLVSLKYGKPIIIILMKVIYHLIGLLVVSFLFIACESEGNEAIPIANCNDQIKNG